MVISAFVMCLYAQQTYGQGNYYPRYDFPGFTGFYDVNDSSSINIVDRYQSYYIMRDILKLQHQIEDQADNRVHFEFHVGGGMGYDADNDTIFPIGFISFKFNLFNPKRPNSKEVINSINELRNLTSITGFELSDASIMKIDAIYDDCNKYNRQFWWKRISVGFSTPLLDRGYDWPYFDYKKSYICVYYDFGDVLTMQGGMNRDENLMIGLSVDLSTPLLSLAEDFKSMVSRLFRLPDRGSGYYW